jgi:hypothetical protein
MTTILEEPYMMRAKSKKGEALIGNDQYEGYCKVNEIILLKCFFQYDESVGAILRFAQEDL